LTKNRIDIKNFNNDFLLIRSEDKDVLPSLGDTILQHAYDFVEEVIVAESEICIALSQSFEQEDIEKLKILQSTGQRGKKVIEVLVFFSNHDNWDDVERISGITKGEIIERICKTKFNARMFGFLPGFIYMDGLDADLHIPRKAVPSKYVEANSIAIGGKYLGLYPLDSPGGWHVIGKTANPLLDMTNLPPSGVNLGDEIRIVAIDEKKYKRLKGDAEKLKN
jgi:KipI family sensor histidine kinase inhibitor